MTTIEADQTLNTPDITETHTTDGNLSDIPHHDEDSPENDNNENLIGIDMVKLGYEYHSNDSDKGPRKFKVRNILRKAKISMTSTAGYVFFKFNINKILGDGTPYSRDTSYYATALTEVEEIIRKEFDDQFSLEACIISMVELHRTFHVKENPYDYYTMLKGIDPKVSRKSSYKENSENSGSIYWVSAAEKFIIYDKTDQLAHNYKKSRDIFNQFDANMVRAEWRLLEHQIVMNKLDIVRPIDLLNARHDLTERFNRSWNRVLPRYDIKPFKKRGTSASVIQEEFDTQKATGNSRYSDTAILNLYLKGLCANGKIDKFLNATKGSRDCNKRLNDIARKIKLSMVEDGKLPQNDLYGELRGKIFGELD